MYDTADVDGAGYLRMWWWVAVPLTGAALIVVFVFELNAASTNHHLHRPTRATDWHLSHKQALSLALPDAHRKSRPTIAAGRPDAGSYSPARCGALPTNHSCTPRQSE